MALLGILRAARWQPMPLYVCACRLPTDASIRFSGREANKDLRLICRYYRREVILAWPPEFSGGSWVLRCVKTTVVHRVAEPVEACSSEHCCRVPRRASYIDDQGLVGGASRRKRVSSWTWFKGCSIRSTCWPTVGHHGEWVISSSIHCR